MTWLREERAVLDTSFPNPLFLTLILAVLAPSWRASAGWVLWTCAEISDFFEIKDLELHPVEFAEKFEPGTVDLGADYRQIAPIESSGRADLVEEHHGKHKIIQDIRIQAGLRPPWKRTARVALSL